MKSVLMRHDGLVQTIGKATESISAIQVDGKNALERIQQVESELLGTFSHTTTVFHDTFAPIWHWDDIGGQTVEIEYSDLGVSGTVDFDDGSSQVIAMSLTNPVFDLFSVEMILRLLPLRDDYQATLEVFHPNQHQLQSVQLSVSKRELVYAGDDKMEDAWVVETKFGDTTRPYQYWIGAETRSLLKQSSTTEQGIVLQFVR
jgi:hypothetical protein